MTSVPEHDVELIADIKQQTPDSVEKNAINHVLLHKNHYLKRLHHLKTRKHGAEWLYKNLGYFQTQFPWELISLVENMAHAHSPEILCKTLKPINTLKQNADDGCYQEQVIGQLLGLEILTTNIRRLLFNTIEDPLNRLDELSIAQADQAELSIWNDWCSKIEKHFQRAEELLQAGQAFFSIRNFRLMEQLPISQRSLNALQRITDKIIDG